MFFIIPCIDMYEKIDMRTQTYNVPPQEVLTILMMMLVMTIMMAMVIIMVMMMTINLR